MRFIKRDKYSLAIVKRIKEKTDKYYPLIPSKDWVSWSGRSNSGGSFSIHGMLANGLTDHELEELRFAGYMPNSEFYDMEEKYILEDGITHKPRIIQ